MSDFALALNLIKQVEGPVSNDAKDPGGLTVYGLTERYDSDWKGWNAALRLLSAHASRSMWESDPELAEFVADHYKVIWDELGLVALGQALANGVIGAYVNQGPRVISWLQEAINAQGAKLKVDCHMGPATVAACVGCPDQEKLYSDFTDFRVAAYEATAKARPTEASYLPGWLNRVKLGA